MYYKKVLSFFHLNLNNMETLILDSSSLSFFPEHLEWWIKSTQQEPHMISLEKESFLQDLLIGIVLLEKEQPIAAAGILKVLDKEKKEIYLYQKKVVELGSNFVALEKRGQHIARLLINKRLEVCKNKNFFPVSVTTNPIIQKIFPQIGATNINGQIEFANLKRDLCICKNPKSDCKICPFQENACWYFP